MMFAVERVARELNFYWDIVDIKQVSMSLSLEKLLSPLATETGRVNRILKETRMLGYRSPMSNF
jgi:hypothetical protein